MLPATGRLSTSFAAAAPAVFRQQCLQQLLMRCLPSSLRAPAAAARCSSQQLQAARSIKAAATHQQQNVQQPAQHPEPVPQADSSVQETLKLLEAGIGPLSTAPMVPGPKARVFVISGPSGVGKDAVLKHLQQRRPDLHFVVTATSRSMRPGEVEGKDYFFVSKQQFEEWIEDGGQLLEHALVYGEYKGIPRQQVDMALQRGCDVVLRIDVQGAATVRKLLPGVVSVFLVAESEAQLVARLVSRKTEAMDKMMTRVQTARDECRQLSDFDYVVVNKEGQLEECVDSLCAIIDVERLKTAVKDVGAGASTAAGGAAESIL